MTRGLVLAVVVASLAGCASAGSPARRSPAGHQPDEETAVLEAMSRYMTAISASDLATMAGMQTADGMTYQLRPGEAGTMHVTTHPNSYWVDPSQDDGHAYRERYRSPSVLIRGGIAVVWAPYELRTDGKTSHCGIDVIDFVKIVGEWLVSNAMWTVEPDACAELRPTETATLRSED